MPGGDRMGPMGMGPMTGRAGGQSEGSPMPGFVGTYGRGGRGFGRGRGSRRRRNRLRATGWTGLQEAPTGVPASGDRQEAAASETSPDLASDAWKQQALSLLKSEAQRYAIGLEQMRKRIAELEAGLHEE